MATAPRVLPLLGNEAVGRGLVEAGCHLVLGYPGTPSSEVLPAAMRFAAIIQQIYIRYVRGQTLDDRFSTFDARVATYIEKGCSIARL